MSARQKLEDLFAGLGPELRKELLDEVLGDHRQELATLVRTFLPKNPDNEADQAIHWAIELAAKAVERGHR